MHPVPEVVDSGRAIALVNGFDVQHYLAGQGGQPVTSILKLLFAKIARSANKYFIVTQITKVYVPYFAESFCDVRENVYDFLRNISPKIRLCETEFHESFPSEYIVK